VELFQFISSRVWHAADLGTTKCSNPSQSSVASFVLQGSTAVFSPSWSFDRWPATPVVGYATHQKRRRSTSCRCGTSAMSLADRCGAGQGPPHLLRAKLFATAGPGGVSLVPNHPVAQARFCIVNRPRSRIRWPARNAETFGGAARHLLWLHSPRGDPERHARHAVRIVRVVAGHSRLCNSITQHYPFSSSDDGVITWHCVLWKTCSWMS